MKMKFTVQKIIATLVVAAITIGLFPKILGNDKVNAAGKHSITVTNGKAYTSDTYTTELAEAEAGADVYVKATDQPGKYVTGWTSSQVTVGEASRFTMPDEDVSVEPIYADQTEYTIDLSGAVQVTNEDVLRSFLWSQGKASLSSLPGSYDLDTDGNVDIDVTYTGGVAEFTLASTCNFSGEIVASTHALYGDNLPYKITFNVPTTYPLWVNYIQVTSANKDDILGDGGKAKYDPVTKTLILDNPSITEHYLGALIFSRDDLTVTGKANLVIDYPSERGIVVVDKSLTINGDITVTGVDYNGKKGFEADGITIVGGNVKTKNVDYGLYSSGDVTISGGTTEINALEYGICVFDGKINITSGITKVDVSGCSEEALQAENGINIDTQLEIAIPLNGVVSSSGGNSYIAESDGTTIAKNVTIVHNGTLSAYPVWVGDTQVTSANKDDILGDGGKAKFDPSTNTLTLNDPTIVGSHEDALIYSEGIDLTLEGSATFSSSTDGAIKVVKSGTNGGVLTLDGDFNIDNVAYDTSAIWADKGINVTGGKITNCMCYHCLKTDGDITISGGTVKASGSACAIYAENDISITGGTVEAKSNGPLGSGIVARNTLLISSGKVSVTNADNGIIGTKKITIEGGTIEVDVLGQGSNYGAIVSPTITITGGDITAKIGTGNALFSSNGAMNISNANIVAESNKGNGISVWHGKLTISSGTVSATGKGTDSIGIDVTDSSIMIANGITSVSATGDLKGISGYFKIMLGDELDIATPASGSLSADEKTIVESDGTTIAKTVKIVHHVGPINYLVWVGNTQVTSANKDDILGDGGKAKYDPATKTLIFNDPVITVRHAVEDASVYVEQDINIEGTLNITAGQFGIIDNGYKHSVTVKGDISIDVSNSALAAKNIEIKDGKLNLSTTSSNTIICKDITISGGYVNIDCSSSSAYAIAALGGGDIVISGGTVIATCSAAYCIESFEGKVIISNGVTKVDAKGASDSIKADAGIEIGEVLNITTPADGIISSDGKFIAESDGTTPASHAVIKRDPAKFPVAVVITTWDKDNNCISEVGGTVTGAPTVTKKGDTIEVTVTPKDGYEIVEISFGDGLISTQTGMSTKFTVPADYTPLTDTVQIDVLFRAKATTPSTYTVTFNTDGGSAVASQTVTSGAKATKPADPAKEGFAFDGWYKDAAFTTAFDFNTAITSDVTVYAKWNATPAVYYTVVSGANGTCTQGTDFVMQIKRSVNDEKTYSDYFTGVKIDDKLLVNGTDYTAAPGSVIVTIKGSTLSDLTVGGHTVTIEFKDGTAVTSLNVKAAANVVKTGEDMSPALWTGVACVGSAVMLFAAVVAQKKRTAVRKSVRKSVMKF